ncbi:hypothetical protein N7499_001060 [Penicillium canescens]|nr:hypothetical protein N7499_001060 [Penicillium canescens]KAJ6173889.1 hypothetical protein N7485_006701 [Penicillium canescens]
MKKEAQGTPRRYEFAWLMCRQRKIKRDGKKPNCEKCLKAKELCNYKENPISNARDPPACPVQASHRAIGVSVWDL